MPSATCETVVPLLGQVFAQHRFDLGRRRPLPQPCLQLRQRVQLAGGDDLDATVGKVSGIALQIEFLRARLRPGAEGHALNQAGNQEARARHDYFFAAAIALSRSVAVIGPVNFFATLPSGAIR